ncbi:MAG TPA: siderophore-interacting protein [Microlunatus sp.]|nr:siderophore-interacting protein [Microlunatus sp.]
MPDRPRKARQSRSATVIGKEWLSPGMVRLHFGGEDLRALPELTFTDHYVKLLFPPSGADYRWPFDPERIRSERPAAEWPVTRTYTIRSFDPVAAEMAIDFVVHGDAGLAGPWAASVEPGDSIGFFGPGGAYAPSPAAPAHLLVGDEAALPAVAAALEALPEDAAADVYLEVADEDHQVPVRQTSRTRLIWVHRGDRPYGAPLAAAVRDGGVPATGTQAFVHGNAELVKDLRRFLFVDHRHDRKLVSISGYWRTGLDEDGWQSSKREFNDQMESEEQAALT